MGNHFLRYFHSSRDAILGAIVTYLLRHQVSFYKIHYNSLIQTTQGYSAFPFNRDISWIITSIGAGHILNITGYNTK